MMGALKLGVGAGVGYTVGGSIGAKVMRTIKSDASPDAITGAAWAGRITTTLVVWYLLARV